MTDRRAFLIALVAAGGCGRSEAPKQGMAPTTGSARAVAEAPPAGTQAPARAQPEGRIRRVAMLFFGNRPGNASLDGAALIRARLRELGHVEGKTVQIDERYADGDAQRLATLAREIVEGKPDVIVAVAVAATAAIRRETATIPIVMVSAGNPVGSGLIETLARPGGNVTGTTSLVPEIGVKQVELVRQLVPGVARLGVLVNPTNAGTAPLLANVTDAARSFNIGLTVAEVTQAGEFDKAFGTLRSARPDAILVMVEPLIDANRARVLAFVEGNRIPAMYTLGGIVRAGGLISYGPVLLTHFPLAADYVDRILKGAKPGDLPVQQSTRFELVINLKAAKALGMAIPQELILRADEVIR